MRATSKSVEKRATPEWANADRGAVRRLLETGIIVPWQFFFAREAAARWNCAITDVIASQGWATSSEILLAWAEETGAPLVDLAKTPPDFRLQHLMSPEDCLKYATVPWIEMNGQIIFATSRPAAFGKLRCKLPTALRNARIALCDEQQLHQYITRLYNGRLAQSCETRPPLRFSCRGWRGGKRAIAITLCAAAAALLLLMAPVALSTLLILLTLLFLTLNTGMKLTALFASRRATIRLKTISSKPPERLPKISVIVPLFKETEIAGALIRRIYEVRYPRALLDVLLVLEESDALTQETLARTALPNWMRVTTVPSGSGLMTKPRAMNYALDFCRGDLIGIWDAEDAPAPDQLFTIAAHFAQAEPEVVCVQGILDYYNPDTNWISRCFTLEYSIWFRVVLRGMAQLGAPIPLGGTTMFIRQNVLEKIGRWDAHNVTEDADLGIRLSRFGYRTELSLTVTQEEANCRFRPWIKQRSRWLKGYIVTYLVHMKNPKRLLHDLGWARFLGVQLILLSALMQFLLAPIIWCFWALALGIPTLLNLEGQLPALLLFATGILALGTLTDFLLAGVAMRGQRRARLLPWALCFLIYFPMASIAAYKALFELISRPFYWHKTAHGQTREGQQARFSAIGT